MQHLITSRQARERLEILLVVAEAASGALRPVQGLGSGRADRRPTVWGSRFAGEVTGWK
jgi:hypothetical protein